MEHTSGKLQGRGIQEPIAIVGSGCRFPGGSTSPSKLWDLLKEPRDIAKEITEDRFNVDRYFHPDNKHHGTSNVRHSYLLEEDFKSFDAGFFGVKPVEALAMDPQQRLLLETVYESLETAGIAIHHLKGSQTGVFVGNMGCDYSELVGQDLDSFPTYFAPGTARSILSNRVSYFFDWHGPSVTIDTACSSSLVAVHQAVQSLRLGEVPVAVACGTNLLLSPSQYIAESKLKMLGPGGRCRMWDESADGYARGEGFASVVLKTLSAALRDGDNIECLIRETGCNQDGRTKGITMPSPLAQAELIRDTYRRAGLDLSKPSDRPQYFEAHGTGTPAGDPVEAEAISTAFFGSASGFRRQERDPKLYVGSVKTVIGHTEGTAGLAALLKASLAIEARRIPPNLHLNRLNPAIEPFYRDLEVPTTLKEWPQVEPGHPLRASVNSFGFGGANAHAILESYEPTVSKPNAAPSAAVAASAPVFAPFTFSANTESSLSKMLLHYRDHLELNPDINLRDLVFTLNNHRSVLDKRTVVSAANLDSLKEKLASRSKEDVGGPRDGGAAKPAGSRPRILGVFTGQGAQWPRMGADLVLSSPAARAILEDLEDSLAGLPSNDRPPWSLIKELLKPAEDSRIHQAHISQTLYTAVQIMLVQLLRAAGVFFDTVVGHSSGEVPAAYTAGYLSARDAIRVSYYRGLNTHWAKGPGGQEGGMMAVGTSYQDAKDLTELDAFAGRLDVGASNSSSSVTLSGDLDALQEAKEILDAEGKFTRMLKVDKAYHSHHMLPCVHPFVRSLQDCGVVALTPRDNSCPWISSVYIRDMSTVTEDRVQDRYWSTNMTKPVMFSQALSYALGGEQPFDYIVEVGPHPALKGPAGQTVQEVLGQTLPYTGCLRRGENSVEALADCLGHIWATLGPSAVNLAGYEGFLSGGSEQRLLHGLPSYAWDHDRSHYFKSRTSKALLTEGTPTNELLGTRATDNSTTQVRWRNSLHSAELPWLLQHHAQGQTVFPGMGYVSTALEAVNQLFGGEPIRTVEIRDLVIGHALVVEENVGAETVFSVTGIARTADKITAHFAFLSHQGGGDPTKLVENASGELHIVLGEPSEDALPGKLETDSQLKDLDEERFYSAIADLGYGYAGPFKALSNLQRRMGAATGLLAIPQKTAFFDRMLVHPAALDATVQSILAAYCFPGDTRLQGIHLPTGVDCIRFNFPHCVEQLNPGAQLPFWASVALTDEDDTQDVGGDVDLYSQCGRFTLIQLQGLHTKPLSPVTAAQDLHLFSEVVWKPEAPAGANLELHGERRVIESEMFDAMERVAYFYMRTLSQKWPPGPSRRDLAQHHVRFLEWADHVQDRVAGGTLQHIHKDWKGDTRDDIRQLVARFPDNIDLQIMSSVGENYPRVFRGEINALEPMVKDNMLNRFYVDAMGMRQYTEDLARMVAHLTHRYPHMKILEVGAGTGGATKVMLRRLDNIFTSYTYTDISSGFFGEAREVFAAYASRMVFKTLDIEKDVVEQGYEEHSFDVVVANLVVHATRKLESTLTQLRRLVKPGGYLLLLEITNNDPLRFGFIFGGLPGWWLGCGDEDGDGSDDDHDGGRVYSPCVGVERWDEVMRKTGFSGVDTLTPHHTLGPLSVILTQAVDDRVGFLRQPLTSSLSAFSADKGHLTIVGGAPSLTEALQQLMQPHYKQVSVVSTLELVPSHDLPIMGTVLSLVELDDPIFRDMTRQKLDGFKQIFQQSKNVYWITCGASGQNPYANMVMGVGRTIVLEMKHVRLGFLDFTRAEDAEAHRLMEKLLQFEASGFWDQLEPPLPAMTWYQEPELRFEEGQFLVPRIRLSKDRNVRYNAKRRLLAREVDPRLHPVSLVPRDQSLVLQETFGSVCAETRPDVVSITVSYALLRSVRLLSSDYLFLVLGTDNATGKHVFAFADSHSSVVEVDRQWTLPCTTPLDQGKQALVSMYEQVLAQTAVQGLGLGDALVVLDATPSMAEALGRRCAEKGIRATLLTTRAERQNRDMIYVHPLAPARRLEEVLPSKISRLLDLSDDDVSGSGYAVRLTAKYRCVPSQRQHESLGSLTDSAARVTTSTFVGLDCAVPDVLRASWAHARAAQGFADPAMVPLVTPMDVADGRRVPVGYCLVDWASTSKCAVRIQPADSMVRFKQDKTYWLVGLTGGLALSICRWMVERGARYVVMTSRNPSIDQKWLESVEALGAKVKIFSNDVTKREAVNSAFKTITATMPPIAGVAQGAMVLQDTMFADTTLDTVDAILGPKVQGSIYLDEIFHDMPLDWFVFLSSIACTSGNPGQSIYAGSNMFMNALAAQRRSRGVAGSSVEIGAIMGNGSVTSKLSFEHQKYLFSVGNMWMSEQDFLTMFAEAVLASPPSAQHSVTTATGLRLHYSDESPDITWFSNPRFQHLVLETGKGASTGANTSKQGLAIKVQLQEAKTPAEINAVLENAFIAKLQSSLQAEGGTELLGASLEALGMDSLVAVDLRSWFLKELAIDVPVLKILNGGTAGELLEFIQETVVASPDSGPSGVEVEQEVEADVKASVEPPATDVVPPAKKTGVPTSPEQLEPLTVDASASTTSSRSGGTPSTDDAEKDTSAEEDDPVSETSLSVFASQEALKPDLHLQRVAPISFGQSRFWFLRSYVEDPLAFNITSLMRINGPLRVDDFSTALEKVCQQHEALRTSFAVEDHLPVQKVWSQPAFQLETRTISDEAEVREAHEMMQHNVFDLEAGKTMRMQLLSKSSIEHFLVLGYHHINMDGISFEVLFRDLEKAYNGEPFNTSVMQYPDFSLREAKQYKSGQWTPELDYWRGQFGTLPEPLPLLPLSKRTSRPRRINYATLAVKRRVSAVQSAAIKETSRRFKTTSFHFYLAVFRALLARHSGQEDFCIGIADANRKESDVMDAIGLYLNLLPLRVAGTPNQTFGEALKAMRQKSQEAFANSKVPFDILLNELNVPRSSECAPLFQALLNYRLGIAEVRPFCGCSGSGELVAGGQIGYDISMDIVENPGGDSQILLAVQKDLYDLDAANALLDNYFNLLDAFAKNPGAQLSRPAMHDAAAVDRALTLGHGPLHEFVWPETLVHRIAEMATTYPAQVALTDGQGCKLTYVEMASRVDAIAAQLEKTNEVVDGSVVGVMQASSVDFICSILAIWKTGAIYVALDARLSTTERLAEIVGECEPACILVDDSTSAIFGELWSAAVPINVSECRGSASSSTAQHKNTSLSTIKAKPDQPAAVLYTSGSTGKPKGVCLSHASLRNNIEVATQQFGFRAGTDVMLQQAAFSFDMSLSQTLLALANGGTLVVAPSQLRGDALGLARLIADEGVTFTQATPTGYMAWIRSGSQHLSGSPWRVAGCGGEPMGRPLLKAFRSIGKPELRLFNVYGPSETTFMSHTREVAYHGPEDKDADISLTTWPNYSVYIVDRELKPVPVGVSGEICIGGGGVGLGYFRDEARTSESFVHDGHASAEFQARGWRTMHKTGDRGRLAADGSLVVEGRIVGDTQIKLRGIRMHLEEIEAAILRTGGDKITDAAVSVRQDGESMPQYLVAHVVIDNHASSAGAGGEDEAGFLAQVAARLPLAQHMKPSALVPVAKLPLNSSNKLDRRAVQALPVRTANGERGDRELTTLQAEVRDLWREVIPADVCSNYTVGPDTDFFHVGGTSLLLVNLQGLLKDKYARPPPALHKMFEFSTLAGMASLLSSDDNTSGQTPSPPVIIDWEEETAIPPSPPQLLPPTVAVAASPSPASPPRTIVLTGATGFLGQHLVRALLRQPHITRIHCIATRPRRPGAPPLPAILTSDPRITIHTGDLASELLGLTPQLAADIFASADVIIHNGADVSFLKTYATLRRSNVGSARALAALAAPRRVPVHFVSSASVAQLVGLGDEEKEASFGEVSAAAWPPAKDARDLATGGYTAAKWAAERILERAAEKWGLDVTVHRPSSIMGEGAGDLDLMQNLLRFVEEMEAVPESRAWRGYVDFVSVENVAQDIVAAAMEGSAVVSGDRNGGKVRYQFESGDIVYPLAVMRELQSEGEGEGGGRLPVRTMPLAEWVDEARKLGLDPMLAEYLVSADESGLPVAFPKLVKGRRA